jgi:RNA polymerase-binding transcription factor DksA
VADTDANDLAHHAERSVAADVAGKAPSSEEIPSPEQVPSPDIDLDAIERDLAAVERALERLSDGSYWSDEVTGEPIPEHVLIDDHTARRA